MTDAALRSVRQTLRRRALVAPGDRVAVALSGGSDSVALTWILRELEADAAWHLAGVIHVHHGLRGADADADEAFCRALAARLDLPIHVAHVDVAAAARAAHRSIESAARDLRYAELARAAATFGATRVATGHTRDDQAETVLLRLFRGAARRGLGAIRPRRGLYVRPVIDCTRQALVDYLGVRGEPFRTDRTNDALDVPRNRLRHLVMPVIVQEWPGAVAALARVAEIAADDEAFLDHVAIEMAGAIVRRDAHGVQLDVRGLSEAPAALARRVVRDAIEQAGATASFRDIEAIRRLARADTLKGRIDLHGLTVKRRRSVLRLWPPAAPRPAERQALEQPLSVPGTAAWPATGMTILASLEEGAAALDARTAAATTAVLQADRVRPPFVVRTRRPGDRFRPLGAPGSRKLQDVLVDRKVPRDARDAVPIVVDATGRIVWVGGVAIAHECRVTAPAAGVVILKMKGTQ